MIWYDEGKIMTKVRGRPKGALILTLQERAYLERQVRRHRVGRAMSERCRIILRCADGSYSAAVAAELGVHEHTVGKWRRRFLKDRIEGLLDEPRPGRPRTIDDDAVAAVIERTLRALPLDATHGPFARWPRPVAIRIRRSAGYGQPSGCSRIAAKPSSSRAIPSSSTRSATSSASTSHRPTGRWC